ncbi:hypothetical protein Lal_00036221 [Lupinus albus]|nr:hypothetical protein Lal_00036221 [Lupinus albus]
MRTQQCGCRRLKIKIKEVIWLAPLPNWIKINSDGATKGAPGLAGGGSIFRDHNGDYLGGFADFFGIKDALFVELQAALKATQIAHQKGWRNICLECDSILVVNIFKGQGVIPWRLTNSWHMCLGYLASTNFKVSHIYGEVNACADSLASFGVCSQCILGGILFLGLF